MHEQYRGRKEGGCNGVEAAREVEWKERRKRILVFCGLIKRAPSDPNYPLVRSRPSGDQCERLFLSFIEMEEVEKARLPLYLSSLITRVSK